MYALYKKTQNNSGFHYQFIKTVSLFGCNVGYIPALLRINIPQGQSEPYVWHINITESLKRQGKEGHTLIINLKPNNATPNLSLYELINVWGYSSSGWTPIMMHIRGLFVDEDPIRFDEKNFLRSDHEIYDPIFSITYLRGTIQNGKLEGKWTTPGISATNSVFLWPDIFEYFIKKAKEILGTFKCPTIETPIDVTLGKLNKIAEKAIDDYKKGKCKEL